MEDNFAMDTLIAIIHVLTALTLIALVLVQDSKSDGLGGAFGGGGSNSILGATGASTLAQKLTRGAAIVFAITSLSLTMISNKKSSVVENLPAAAAAAPVTDSSATTTTVPAAAASTESTTTTTAAPKK